MIRIRVSRPNQRPFLLSDKFPSRPYAEYSAAAKNASAVGFTLEFVDDGEPPEAYNERRAAAKARSIAKRRAAQEPSPVTANNAQ